MIVNGNSVILRVKQTYTTVLTARSVPRQAIRKIMPTAKGSNAISELAFNSEVKQRSTSPHLPMFCGSATGTAIGKNTEGISNKTAGISLFLVQHINGNREKSTNMACLPTLQ
jgi:hypothetical protein